MRDAKGRYGETVNVVKTIVVTVFLTLVALGTIRSIVIARSLNKQVQVPQVAAATIEAPRTWVGRTLTDAEYYAIASSDSYGLHGDAYTVVKGSVTKYSRIDSCHNKNDKGECITASGKPVKHGITVACPHKIKLGTKVAINGKIYTCEDRTARWVQAKFGDTFDIFDDSHSAAVKWGRQNLKVAIMN